MGQALAMGRYPIHWHLAGNASGQYVRNASLHSNFQRCATVHGTSDVELADNVCHDTFGHAFYLEDGIETGNIFRHNLVVSSHPGGSVCTDFLKGGGPRSNVQLGPSGFWITNPDNRFMDNHVVGVGTGYWFTFPISSPGGCLLAPGSRGSCSSERRGAGGVFGPSRRYFDDAASGYGPDHWWTNQEQARTPVAEFRGNVVSGAHRGIFIDGRVYDSGDSFISEELPGGNIPCLADGCPTCSGPLEGSFTWAPMVFDKSLPPHQRSYQPSHNLFEDFYAAHIVGHVQLDESRGLWASGGVIRFRGAVFFNVYVVAAASEDLTGGCNRASDGPPGFPISFRDSLFVAGLWACVWLLGTWPLGRPLGEGWRFMLTVSVCARCGFSAAWMFITNFTHSHPWNHFLARDPERQWPMLHDVMSGSMYRLAEILAKQGRLDEAKQWWSQAAHLPQLASNPDIAVITAMRSGYAIPFLVS